MDIEECVFHVLNRGLGCLEFISQKIVGCAETCLGQRNLKGKESLSTPVLKTLFWKDKIFNKKFVSKDSESVQKIHVSYEANHMCERSRGSYVCASDCLLNEFCWNWGGWIDEARTKLRCDRKRNERCHHRIRGRGSLWESECFAKLLAETSNSYVSFFVSWSHLGFLFDQIRCCGHWRSSWRSCCAHILFVEERTDDLNLVILLLEALDLQSERICCVAGCLILDIFVTLGRIRTRRSPDTVSLVWCIFQRQIMVVLGDILTDGWTSKKRRLLVESGFLRTKKIFKLTAVWSSFTAVSELPASSFDSVTWFFDRTIWRSVLHVFFGRTPCYWNKIQKYEEIFARNRVHPLSI